MREFDMRRIRLRITRLQVPRTIGQCFLKGLAGRFVVVFRFDLEQSDFKARAAKSDVAMVAAKIATLKRGVITESVHRWQSADWRGATSRGRQAPQRRRALH